MINDHNQIINQITRKKESEKYILSTEPPASEALAEIQEVVSEPTRSHRELQMQEVLSRGYISPILSFWLFDL
jgi:hypothetical protein